jgi:hypothetical protein
MSIPLKDSSLVPFTTNFNDRIVATPTDFGLTAGQAAAYTPLNDAYVAAYNAMMAARSDGTRSASQTATTVAARNTLIAYARQLYAFVQANADVTDANKILLGVAIRKTPPSPIPAPTARPKMDLISVVARTVTVAIHNGSVTKRGKPVGAISAFVYTFVGENYPTDPTQWEFQGAATKSPYPIEFPDSVTSGAQVWMCAAWVNRRGQAGPPGTPISTNVQGGGVSASSMKIAA